MKLRITLNDKTFEVDVEVAEGDTATLPPAYPIGSAVLSGSVATAPAAPASVSPAPAVDEAKVCRSPVSGIVVRLVAQRGQSLQVGDPLMVLEAMKMETNITAPKDGIVSEIVAKAGARISSGDLLLVIE